MAEQADFKMFTMDNGQSRDIQIRLAAELGNLGVVRALVAAVAAAEDLNVDSLADLRLAIDETATALIRCAQTDATLLLQIHRSAEAIDVEASVPCRPESIVVPKNSFSWHVLKSLTDDIAVSKRNSENSSGQEAVVTLTVYHRDGAW